MAENGKIKVLIADDHPPIRIGIKLVLAPNADIAVVGEAANGQEAVQQVEEQSPDVLLLDLQMPIMDGFEVLKDLCPRKAGLKILVLSANNDRYIISETLAMGAWGYYMKEEAPGEIVNAIRKAIQGEGKGRRPGVSCK